MLSKSKSKNIHLIKYLFLIPMVLAMLAYTSSYAQGKPKINENQELSFNQMVERYHKEFLAKEAEGVNVIEQYHKNGAKKNAYIVSEEEWAKYHAYMKFAFKVEVNNKELQGNLKKEDISLGEGILNNLKSYEEYLEWKKTDEAKEIWENNSHDGILRLVVNKIGQLTDQEKKKKENKIELLNRDPFFTKLVILDIGNDHAYFTVTITPDENNGQTQVSSVQESVEVPYATIEQPPVFDGCEDLLNEKQKKCTSDKISKHVQENFNVELAGELGLKGRQRISVIFKINKLGKIEGVKSRAPHPKLEEEAIRVIQSLPNMIPGKHGGENVIVPYSLPIIFEVAENNESPKEKTKESKIVNSDGSMPFSIIDEAPVFQGCENISAKDEQKKCTSDKINKFVVTNFNTDLPSKLGLKGKLRIYVILKIDTQGNVNIDRIRSPHKDLEVEVKRVINLFPKMIPGKHEGKNVNVVYTLPIAFMVAE